ncbi:MAG: type II toxin-antitoxin system HicB family antitoxin [Acidobacteria bacterium]|nr:type II toxin-antitoxin system HicB family antitoxin [Acidobacteriota bacterium]
MKNKYKFNLAWSDEDEGYIATCPEFVGLSAFGTTPEKALAEAQVALKLFIESYLEDGTPLPKPEIVQGYSGQLRLRLPKSLHARAAQKAAEDGTSLNQYITLAVESRVSGQEVARRISQEVKNQLVANSAPQYRKFDNIDLYGGISVGKEAFQVANTSSEYSN